MAKVAASRVGTRYRTTLPRKVTEALDLKPGDTVRYEIEDNQVRLAKRQSDPDPFEHFSEWNSAEDEKAYASL